MSTDSNQYAAYTPRMKEFFLARQPILDREQGVTAYELLFRRAAAGPAGVIDDVAATASVIAHASELGIENVIGGAQGFFNVDAAVLMSDFIKFLPRNRVVLEILETVEITPQLVARVAELESAGFSFALDDVIADSDDIRKLLPLIKVIKIDITGMGRAELVDLVRQFKPSGKMLLAEKVETLEQFRDCLEFGFDFFQGYYFAKPVILSGKKLAPSQLAIMQLMTLIAADADTGEIEISIKQDASLGLTLLRLVNTPGQGVTQRIDSLSKALMVLGRRQLQRWLQIMLYAEPLKNANFVSPLLLLATTRGRLLELAAERLRPGNAKVFNTAFTVGIMSLMDTLFCQPMAELLERFSVVSEVTEALLERQGFYGDLLLLAEFGERGVEADAATQLLPVLERLQLTVEELSALQVQAFEWSDSIARSAR